MTQKIHSSMIAVMRDLEAIGKEKNNAAQGFKYRGIDDVYNALHPILSKHGVYMTAEVVSKSREERTNAKGTVLAFTSLKMRYHFWAEDGSEVWTEAEGEGMDSGDKSSNKAMAVAHKYALLQAFCIPTQDMEDPDAQVHEVTTRAEPPKPKMTPAEWVEKAEAELLHLKVATDLTVWLQKNNAAIESLQTKDKALYNAISQKIANRNDELRK